MTIKPLTAVAIGALMLSPIAASADSVAASLSASFGTAPTGGVNVGATTFVTPQSLSVAAAAGERAVASSVATPFTTGAAAGAGGGNVNVPFTQVFIGASGAYESNVSFGAPADLNVFEIVEGPQGPQGDTGPQGPQGDTGPQGAPGTDGTDTCGNTVVGSGLFGLPIGTVTCP